MHVEKSIFAIAAVGFYETETEPHGKYWIQILSHVHVVKTFNLFHGHIIMHENIFCPENTLHIKKLWSYGALTIDE